MRLCAKGIKMKTKIEFIQVSGGFCWFLDVFVIDKISTKGCWKNIGAYKTQDEAIRMRLVAREE